jgi:multidrug resistance efflux pump
MIHDAAPDAQGSPRNFGATIQTLAILGIALAAGVWLSGWLDQQAHRAFPGRLQAQLIALSTEQPATLREVRVQTGQRVAAGDPLFVLECEARQIEAQRRREEAAHRVLEAKRIKASADLELNWRRRELQAEMFQTQLKLAALRQEKLHLEVEQIAWHEQLSVQTIFSSEERPSPLFRFLGDGGADAPEGRLEAMLKQDAAAAAAEAMAVQIALCEQRLVELKDLDQKLEQQVRLSLGVDAAEEQQRQAAAAVPEEIANPAALTVTSPSYGVLGVFHKQPGERLTAGETLVQILDDDRRTIDVEVPSWAAVRFTPGLTVRLEFPGRAERTGVIAAIPPQTASTIDTAGDAPVKLTISPSGKSWPQIPIGSRVLVFQP